MPATGLANRRPAQYRKGRRFLIRFCPANRHAAFDRGGVASTAPSAPALFACIHTAGRGASRRGRDLRFPANAPDTFFPPSCSPFHSGTLRHDVMGFPPDNLSLIGAYAVRRLCRRRAIVMLETHAHVKGRAALTSGPGWLEGVSFTIPSLRVAAACPPSLFRRHCWPCCTNFRHHRHCRMVSVIVSLTLTPMRAPVINRQGPHATNTMCSTGPATLVERLHAF